MTHPFPDSLAVHADRIALVTRDGAISYAQLAERVEAAMGRLGPDRRLVLLAGANEVDAIVLYLAALAGRHPLILADADKPDALAVLADAYDPDVIARPGRGGDRTWTIDERRDRSHHDLHPDLALLLSTSGSTGSPKLVRLSRTNVQANAESIASYLDLGPTDRAITSLPMSYSYGLSVINSHLVAGGTVVLTDRSVIEGEFWDLFRRTEATSLAGVPYTFDLLDRIGFADMALPDLRRVTQAGGRLDPATVRRYAEMGQLKGWELVVMYGQTEATARMAYLPPALATSRPESIGVAIPGGNLSLAPVPGAPPGVGELVYRGPNVMLGYAEGPSDLGLGRSVDELRTGDLGRQRTDGLYEVVGRRGRFLKIAGLRVDPHDVERIIEQRGGRACAVGTDDGLVVFAEPGVPDGLQALIRDRIGLPLHAVRVIHVDELPRLSNGKLDRQAMHELAETAEDSAGTLAADRAAALRNLYATSLGRGDITDDDSFASLGGDSLSYVEVTMGLEQILGRLPDDWATKPLRQLHGEAPPDPTAGRSHPLTRWRSIEMSVALRAVAIALVVATHIGMVFAPGGAHVLMAVAGFNFARFRLTTATRTDRVWSQLRAVARIAIPAMLWVGLAMLVLDQYELRHLLLINALVRDELWGNLWFIELLVYISLAMAALLAVPAVDRAERRWPFAAALAVLAVGLLFRFGVLDFGVPYTKPVLWLFALGWAASRAERPWQRGLVAVLALLSVPGYFDAWERNSLILVGVLLLIGVPRIRVPAFVAPVVGVLASASLYIYLVHWEVWPIFRDWYGVPSLVASLLAGIALWMVATKGTELMSRMWDHSRRDAAATPRPARQLAPAPVRSLNSD